MLFLLRSSHWLYMKTSWDRRRLIIHNTSPTCQLLTPNLISNTGCAFQPVVSPEVYQSEGSHHHTAPLIKQVLMFSCGQGHNTGVIWRNPIHHHHKQPQNICQMPLWHTVHKNWSKYVVFGKAFLLNCSILHRSAYYHVHPLHIASIDIQMDLSVLPLKKRKASWNNIFAIYWESELWTINLLLWEYKKCEIMQGRYWHV